MGDLSHPRMLFPPSIHKSKGILHQLKALDVACPASSNCVGGDIKVTPHTVEVSTDQDMAMVWYHWQQKVPEEAHSVCGCAGSVYSHHRQCLLLPSEVYPQYPAVVL